ncbi:MAG TPA: PH domain-containing protein [Rhizomicrobium sp.]|nr:PH domain-containing protein [Rhizomicrobium sp.]
MSYIEQSLGQGETVIARAEFSWVYSFLAWLALIFLGIFIIGIVIFLAMMIRKWTTEIGVTSHRFVEKTGLFTLRTNEIALANIEGVRVHQGFFGKLFGYGTVRIEGTGIDAVTTPNINDPVGFVRAIQTAREFMPRARA